MTTKIGEKNDEEVVIVAAYRTPIGMSLSIIFIEIKIEILMKVFDFIRFI